jgi:hypothetical protein
MRAATLRRAALALPEAQEIETWDTATFRIHGRIFAMFSDHERDVWIKSTHDEQAALTSMQPGVFFVPPYVGPNGWIGARVSKADAQEIAELVTEGWRMTAPKRLVRAFDEDHG